MDERKLKVDLPYTVTIKHGKIDRHLVQVSEKKFQRTAAVMWKVRLVSPTWLGVIQVFSRELLISCCVKTIIFLDFWRLFTSIWKQNVERGWRNEIVLTGKSNRVVRPTPFYRQKKQKIQTQTKYIFVSVYYVPCCVIWFLAWHWCAFSVYSKYC